MSDRPATWQDEQAAVEAAFERSGAARTWPDDEPDQMVPMVNAMADEVARLRAAARALLDGVNERHPDKNPREWACPHMAELDRLVPPLDEK